MNISGTTMIFAKDFEEIRNYCTSISKKQQDGTYEKMYITVGFNKDVRLEDKTKINILDGFLTFYKNRNGLSIPKIRVMNFETVDNFIPNDEEVMSPDQLPF